MIFGKRKEDSVMSKTNYNSRSIRWGDAQLGAKEATGGFMAVGAPGSGKSVLLQLLMQSVLPEIQSGSDDRALVYDAKMNAMSLLHGICPNADIRTSDPFDERGWYWDMQADVREVRVAIEIAFLLIPETHESQPFFSDAARHLLAMVMISFMLSGVEWTLADLIRVFKSERRIKAVLKKHPQTRELIAQYFSQHDKRLSSNILSTCAVKCLRYEPVAAAWEAAPNGFSLRDWVTNNWILILGNAEESRVAIDCLNRALFKRASDLVLNQSDSFNRRTWFFIDEMAEAPKLDGLVSLLKKGRSKGACVATAFQSISGLRDQTKYGQYFADEVLGQIANRFFGRIECVETAEWASRLFGDQEYEAVSTSVTNGPGGRSHTTSTQIQTRRLVMPGELMSLPTCSRESGLHGFNLVRSVGAYRMEVSGEELFGSLLKPHAADVSDFVRRDTNAQFLRAWTKRDGERLGHIESAQRKSRERVKGLNQLKVDGPRYDDLDDLMESQE